MSRNRRRKSGKDWVEGNEDNTLLKLHRAQRLLREERESKKRLLADLELARERVSIALAITETVTPRPIKERSRAKNKREATPRDLRLGLAYRREGRRREHQRA